MSVLGRVGGGDDSAHELGVKSLGYPQHWIAIQMKSQGSWEGVCVVQNFPVSEWLSLDKKSSFWIPGKRVIIAITSSFPKYSAEGS